jgi:hypothetical protein
MIKLILSDCITYINKLHTPLPFTLQLVNIYKDKDQL